MGQGSAQPSAAVILRWDGVGRSDASDGNLVFVGKGVCFDSGGISLKPGQGMEDMKGDMAGAAAVAGVMTALARRKAPVRAVRYCRPGGKHAERTATRPGDIVTSASGQTIEILNTDAEGRLVLADLIWYAQAHLEPKLIITLATLTGAILVALGKEMPGCSPTTTRWLPRSVKPDMDIGETVWRLPLSKKYNKMIDSKLADMKNIGGRDAGSITAAQFLHRFVKSRYFRGRILTSPARPWALRPPTSIASWGSGYGVRLLDHFSNKFYEPRSEPK